MYTHMRVYKGIFERERVKHYWQYAVAQSGDSRTDLRSGYDVVSTQFGSGSSAVHTLIKRFSDAALTLLRHCLSTCCKETLPPREKMKGGNNVRKRVEPRTVFYYEVYQKLRTYYECAINEKERKNKKFFKKKGTISELKKIQDDLVNSFDTNVEIFSNPFHFLTYEEEDVNKNELKNYLGNNYPNMISMMDDIVKCSIIVNRNVYAVCELFNEVYLRIEKENIVSEMTKSMYICEFFKECIEKENLIIMIILEILKYINRNQKIGVSPEHGHKFSKAEYYSEREDNYTDNELKKNEDIKTSSVQSSATNNSIGSLNISRKISKNSINRKINSDRFSLYILISMTENDFVENIFSEIDRILKFLVKHDDTYFKIDHVFNYKMLTCQILLLTKLKISVGKHFQISKRSRTYSARFAKDPSPTL
ncbi:conserved Plasmodium protein, unknown function [Plasmodium ovale wallikeri]|uniref:Uncharacterized protein n=1 Tax=Plasmodium ovale wallikeri TaxID=864142 RepID=A0A1A8Z6V4_PLAOA|nr:conserved Plasmodium protein, unknown function [Plasmodium ovale wallikeri]